MDAKVLRIAGSWTGPYVMRVADRRAREAWRTNRDMWEANGVESVQREIG